MSELTVRAVVKSFGRAQVLRGVDLEVPARSVTAVLGPSGCGKTTLLRLIAGFARPDAGTIELAGRMISGPRTHLPPEARGLGYLAQEGALFPHLTVARNITFGLPRRRRGDRGLVRELLDVVSLEPDLADRYPHQLSGGQQQRVALARTLAPQPRLILLDEPFSALDTGLRAETRTAVAAALSAAGVTAVLVTHDQGEALSFADRVAVMHGGVFTQAGSPSEVYLRPVDLRTAEFLGDTCVTSAELVGDIAVGPLGAVPIRRRPGDPVTGRVALMVRPEQLQLSPDEPGQVAGVPAVTRSIEYFGHDCVVTAQLLGNGSAPVEPGQAPAASSALRSPVTVTCRTIGSVTPPGTRVRISVAGTGLIFPEHPQVADLPAATRV